MPADSSAIDAALLAKLADPTLAGLCPDGVHFDVAPQSKTRFVIVQLVIHEDTDGFDTPRAWERAVYLVKAVILESSGGDVKAAAARIDALLQRVPLTITGYDHMTTLRRERIRYLEVDAVAANIRWQHRGGQYEIYASPIT